jgi:hypothetical protein
MGARVQPELRPVPEAHPRHIEIVTSRAQRRARPKVMHAVVTLGALFVIFAAQLLLSIAVSDGAYQIAALQQTQKELARTEDALAERLATLNSPQNLVANAASLGMVIATDAAYLRLADGAVIPAPAQEIRFGCVTMCGLIGNELTKGLTLVTPAAAAAPQTTAPSANGTTAGGATTGGTAAGGATSNGTTTGGSTVTVPSTETLPAPVTR